jgi:hypothetical protein
VATSFCRIVILSIPIIVQLLLATMINRYAQFYNLALIAASGRNAALAAALAKQGGRDQRVEELSHADNMLQVWLMIVLAISLSPPLLCVACFVPSAPPEKKPNSHSTHLSDTQEALQVYANEIISEHEAYPMRVAFVKAEPAAVSMIISTILTIVALQINGARLLL